MGGHCIGVDPYYLTFKAEESGYKPDLILASRQINNSMSKHVADQTIKYMIKSGKIINDSDILILGMTFKEDCPDMRNTKVIDIIEELKYFGVNVDVYDPWADSFTKECQHNYGIIGNPLKSDRKYDAIILAVGHYQFKSYTMVDYDKLSKGEIVLMDVKNIAPEPTWRL